MESKISKVSKISSITSEYSQQSKISEYSLKRQSEKTLEPPSSKFTNDSSSTQNNPPNPDSDSKPKERKKKEKKHIIDKVGPFASKGREQDIVLVGGGSGMGLISTKKSLPSNEKENFSEKNVPSLQSAITQPKSTSANPQSFGSTQRRVPKPKAIRKSPGVSTDSTSRTSQISNRAVTLGENSELNHEIPDKTNKDNYFLLDVCNEESKESEYTYDMTGTGTYYTKDLDDKVEKDLSFFLSKTIEKLSAENDIKREKRIAKETELEDLEKQYCELQKADV